MLSTLVLENFKAFGRRQIITLAPITLIFGANSAGKSSILQSLLLLKQTLNEAETNETLLLPKGDLVNLGSFREFLFEHNAARTCEIAPLVAVDHEERSNPIMRRRYPLPDEGPVGAGFRFRFDPTDEAIKLDSLPYYWGDARIPAFSLVPMSPPPDAERAFSRLGMARGELERSRLSGYATYARPGEFSDGHLFWRKQFEDFSRRLLPTYVQRLESALSALDSVRTSNTTKQLRRSEQQLLFLLRAEPGTGDLERKAGWFQRDLQRRLARLKQYDLGLFLEDVRERSSRSSVALRNFLPDDVAIGRGGDEGDETTSRRLFERITATDPDRPGLPDEFLNLGRLSVFFATALRRNLDGIVYLGPLREYPERHYIFSGNVAKEVGKSGRMLPDLLFKNSTLVENTNRLLREFGVGYTLEVRRVSDRDIDDVFGLRLVDETRGTTVSVLDVGFGISQVLPVIVQSTLSTRNIILIEQPEIHLHPKLQAELGTLFARSITPPQQNQFIIETHSEHLILRVQRLIRKGELRASDVSVIYVTREEDGSHCYSLRMDSEGGFIDRWPEGFFEESLNEVFA